MPDSAAAHCSFCLERDQEVAQLIEGPGTNICDGCVALCVTILKTPPSGDPGPAVPTWGELDDRQLLARLPRIAAAAAQVEGSLRRWVGEARRRDLSWVRIGEAMGMARQSAWERFAERG